MTDHRPLALVIGATGGVGGALAHRLLADGWRVRALNRDPERAKARSGRTGLEWVRGDALVKAEVAEAAEGADVIVHGANPPGYRNWAGLQMPMLRSTIAAAKLSGARILFPGSVYNFGPDAFPVLTEDSPQNPTTRKGRIRVRMEQALAEAADAGTRVLIVRTGDFFGPSPGANWLPQAIVRPGRPIAAVTWPGPPEVAHAWAYLPDVAETFVRLLEHEDRLEPFEVFHMRGQTVTGAEFVAALEAASGRKLAVRKLPWFGVQAAAPFNETFREMLEMRYLWDRPVLMANAKLARLLGQEPHTPLVDALRAALAGQGALPVGEAVAA